jgi:hypothetical protein
VWGPYLPLDAGTYEATWKFHGDNCGRGTRLSFDVAREQTPVATKEVDVTAADTTSIRFDVKPGDVQRWQLRAHAAPCDVTLSDLRLERDRGAPIAPREPL